MVIIVIVIFGAGVVLLISDYRESVSEISGGITRNSYGKGTRTEMLQVRIAGEKEASEVEVAVSEKAYSAQEMQEVFRRVTEKMDQWILGSNKSLEYVDSDMHLITEVPGEPIDVMWELSRYDVMNVYGELNEEKLVTEGTLVTLHAVLTYREDRSRQALYECSVMVYPKMRTEAEKVKKELSDAIREKDEKTQTEEKLILPDEVDGKKVQFYRVMEKRGFVLLIMAVIMTVLLYALERQNRWKEDAKRRRQMELDYPEIISKLTLLLGAGMTVKRAWKKIAEDYGKGKDRRGIRYAYEEMVYTCHEMDSGIMESESYERFGRRCGTQEYLKLGALLSQNLRKGTKGLGDMMQMEAVQAFAERKARARRLGEEAGTKLLLPMFLMLFVVLIIVIIPAFLSIQL